MYYVCTGEGIYDVSFLIHNRHNIRIKDLIFNFSTTQEVNRLVSQLPASISALTGVDIGNVFSANSSNGVRV